MPCLSFKYYPDSSHWFTRIRHLSGAIWLDGEQAQGGRYSVLSAEPNELFKNPSHNELKQQLEAFKQRYQKELKALETFPFCGGLIGYNNYEDRHQHFSLSTKNKQQSPSYWGLFDWALIQDHENKSCHFICLANETSTHIQNLISLLQAEDKQPCSNYHLSSFKHDQSKQDYLKAFEQIQSYIHAGDCYQINYSQRFSAQFSGDPSEAYLQLRKHIGGPYSAYIALGEQQVLSLSPEQFVQIQDKRAQTKPIKGTIRRGVDEQQDKSLACELLQSEKNRAENLMIVDLLRNDFGQNCKAASVKVPHLFALESYANVHHLVSTVTGELNDGIDELSFYHDCFPGGSITGAPKKRAMEIIDELEPHPRNIYCGSIVCISANGRLNSSIAIRTLLIKDNSIYCWGGGGIVADSKAEEEYQESLQKVGALMRELEAKSIAAK